MGDVAVMLTALALIATEVADVTMPCASTANCPTWVASPYVAGVTPLLARLITPVAMSGLGVTTIGNVAVMLVTPPPPPPELTQLSRARKFAQIGAQRTWFVVGAGSTQVTAAR